MSKTQTVADDVPIPFDKDAKYTVEQVAAMLQMSTKTIYTWIKERKLHARRFKGSKKIIITASQINAFADEAILKKWFPEFGNLDELDPAYAPPELEEVDIDSLTEEELRLAYVIPPELGFTTGTANTAEWIRMAKEAGLDKG